MIYKDATKKINEIMKDKNTTAVGFFHRTGDQDGLHIAGCDEGLSESWIVVEIMLNMLSSEFVHENSAKTITRFLNKLGYYPTQEEVESAYLRMIHPIKNAN